MSTVWRLDGVPSGVVSGAQVSVTPEITPADLLVRLTDAPCKDQWAIVLQEWPDGIPLTEATIARARELELDLEWLGEVLPGLARAEYHRATDPAWAAYQRVRDAAILDALRSLVSP